MGQSLYGAIGGLTQGLGMGLQRQQSMQDLFDKEKYEAEQQRQQMMRQMLGGMAGQKFGQQLQQPQVEFAQDMRIKEYYAGLKTEQKRAEQAAKEAQDLADYRKKTLDNEAARIRKMGISTAQPRQLHPDYQAYIQAHPGAETGPIIVEQQGERFQLTPYGGYERMTGATPGEQLKALQIKLIGQAMSSMAYTTGDEPKRKALIKEAKQQAREMMENVGEAAPGGDDEVVISPEQWKDPARRKSLIKQHKMTPEQVKTLNAQYRVVAKKEKPKPTTSPEQVDRENRLGSLGRNEAIQLRENLKRERLSKLISDEERKAINDDIRFLNKLISKGAFSGVSSFLNKPIEASSPTPEDIARTTFK